MRDLPTIHVGFAKTATTTLQLQVLARHPGLVYVAGSDRGGANGGAVAMIKLRTALRLPDGAGFDLEARRRRHAEEVAPLALSGKPLLLSDEDFSFQGALDDGLEAQRVVSRVAKAERLRAVVGPAQVVLVVRQPLDWVRSLYLQKLRGYGKKYRRIALFGDWLAAHWERRDELASHVSNLRYFELANAYAELFGRENVAVLAYEQLVAEPDVFMAAFARHAGFDEAVAVALLRKAAREKPTLTARQHWANHLAAKSSLAAYALRAPELAWARRVASIVAPGRRPKRVDAPAQLAGAVADFARDDCRRLAAEWELPLARYGYPV